MTDSGKYIYRPTWVEVYTIDVLSDEEHSRRIIDHNSSEAREWLHRHMYWAMRNQKYINLFPTDDPSDYSFLEGPVEDEQNQTHG